MIVFRFIKIDKPVERFLAFVDVHDRSAAGLFEVLKQRLEPYKLQDKLVAQAYDGANTMRGHTGGVQTLMKTVFKNAKYVHCYAHQLNLVVKNACSNVKPVKLFFVNITGFSIFFSSSPKRMDVLKDVCNRCLPTVPQTRWNFQSRVVNSVKELRVELIKTFDTIEEGEGWDDMTIREACGLKNFSKMWNFYSI